MLNNKYTVIIVALLVIGAIGWKFTDTIKEKNAVERERIASNEQLKREELEQDKQIKEASLNRDLEADCQKQIAALRLRFNNIEGGGYDTYLGYCEVSYRDTKTKEIERSNVQNMVTVE